MSINPHPELPVFEYVHPVSLEEASQFLANHAGEARPLCGGTDIFVRMRDGHWNDKYLVDIKALDGTQEIKFDPQNGLFIGSAVNMNRVIRDPNVISHYPLVAEAARTVASYQLRTRATIVGNICNASPAGDTIGACIVLNGRLKVHGTDGFRWVPLAGFFTGPGKTSLKPGDIVTGIELPLPPKSAAGKYIKLGRNQLSDLSIVGVTVLGYPDESLVSGYRFKIALASVAPVPLVSLKAETRLGEGPINPAVLEEAAQLAESEATPIDDVRGSARYRKSMVRNLTYKALWMVWEKIGHLVN